MTFEVELRERLQREAAAVPLPGRDPRIAASRARTIRHRRRLTAASMVILSAALVVGAPLLLANQAGDENGTVSSGQTYGLPSTGVIDLEWTTAPDGLSFPTMSFEDADGVVYALSTAPGRLAPGEDMAPRALYRLGEDGTWQPVVVDENRELVADLARGEEGLLYGIGTAPAGDDDDDGVMARLSTSGDGGETWTTNLEVEPAIPPNDMVPWQAYTDVGIDTNGETTLAAVTTSFFPELESLFPELDDDPDGALSVELRAEGATLVRYDLTAEVTEVEASAEVARSGAVDPENLPIVTPAEPIPVRTIPWAEIGVEDQSSLSTTRLFIRSGDGWEDVTTPEFGNAGAASLTVAAGRFVAVGYGPGGTEQSVVSSEDGRTWAPVVTPADGEIFGFGDGALANLSWLDNSPSPDPAAMEARLDVSTDAGLTWTEVDLADLGLDEGATINSARGGPLGLAVLVGSNEMGTTQKLLFTGDLVDWTEIDVAELTGLPDTSGFEVIVGENQVVITATDMSRPARSATAVGTPVR